ATAVEPNPVQTTDMKTAATTARLRPRMAASVSPLTGERGVAAEGLPQKPERRARSRARWRRGYLDSRTHRGRVWARGSGVGTKPMHDMGRCGGSSRRPPQGQRGLRGSPGCSTRVAGGRVMVDGVEVGADA